MYRAVLMSVVLMFSVALSVVAEDIAFTDGNNWNPMLHPWSAAQLRDGGEIRIERGTKLVSKELGFYANFTFEWAWEAQSDKPAEADALTIVLFSKGVTSGDISDGIRIVLDTAGKARIVPIGNAKVTEAEKEIPITSESPFAITPRDYHTVEISMIDDTIVVRLDEKVVVTAKYNESYLREVGGKRIIICNRHSQGEDSVSYASYLRNPSFK